MAFSSTSSSNFPKHVTESLSPGMMESVHFDVLPVDSDLDLSTEAPVKKSAPSFCFTSSSLGFVATPTKTEIPSSLGLTPPPSASTSPMVATTTVPSFTIHDVVSAIKDNDIPKGTISFRIERFSTLSLDHRYSKIVKIGKHEWSLHCSLKRHDDTKYLSLFLMCNPFVKESSYTAQIKLSMWLFNEGDKIHMRKYSQMNFNSSSNNWGWPKFVPKDSIPDECVVNDTLTVGAEIEVFEEVCPFASFVSPNDCQVASLEETRDQVHPCTQLNDELFSDVIFFVGPKKNKIFGHQSVIVKSSLVFDKIFSQMKSGFSQSKYDEGNRLIIEIEDPDVHPTALLSIFRFMYRKEVVVNRQLIDETLYAANKFDVRNFLESLGFLVTPKTVCHFAPFVFKAGETHPLFQRCLWVISSQIKQVVRSTSFLGIPKKTLKEILAMDCLEIRELDLFNSYVKWADHRLQKGDKPVNDHSRRSVMKHLRLIRFPIMSLQEFASGPAATDILTSDEKADVFRFLTVKAAIPFPVKLRNF